MQKETLKVVKNQALIVYQQEWEKGIFGRTNLGIMLI
ncbi:hypothetical protein Dip510_001620 [Elusimicrobium posterum]